MSSIEGLIPKIKERASKFLESSSDIEYLFVSIYRINYKSLDRKKVMTDIINHLNIEGGVKTTVKLITRFSTIYNNHILGLEVQSASIYGQKIEMAFDDFDRKLANTIRKNDIIIVHRINKRKLKVIDAMASMIGIASSSSSGVNETTSSIPMAIKNKIKPLDPDKPHMSISDRTSNKIADQFLMKEKPIFAGLITLPQTVMGNNIKLTIEAQDMIRIMQHINTEEHTSFDVDGMPEDMDTFISELKMDNRDSKIEVRGKDHLAILQSSILLTLASAVYEEVKSYRNVSTAKRNQIKFFNNASDVSSIQRQMHRSHDQIILRAVSNGMFIVHISPLRALKLFVKYYAKNTGINSFFDFDMWGTDFFDDPKIIETIYKKIYKNTVGINPFFTFGLMLNFDKDERFVSYKRDQINLDSRIFDMIKKHPPKSVFTEKTFNNIFKNRVNEIAVLKYLNNEKLKENDNNMLALMGNFFMNIVGAAEIDIADRTGTLSNGDEIFLSNSNTENPSFIISKEARLQFNKSLNRIRDEFSNTISLDYVVSTNFSSVRSTEYNPVLTNQMKSVPITQIMQLFVGAMTNIPISQSKETTGFANTAHNISQRIWLSSAIGFKHPRTNVQSWVYKKGFKPVVFFGLNYNPSVKENGNITYVTDKDIINSKMFTLPSVGSLAIYEWGVQDLHIGYAKFNEGDLNSNIPHLSLGGSMVFDLRAIAGSVNNYVSENEDKQIGIQGNIVNKSIPRIGVFKLEDAGSGTAASDALAIYDDFSQIRADGTSNKWIYLGYDLYAMNGNAQYMRLADNTKVKLYAPMVESNTKVKLIDLGANIFNAGRENVSIQWKDRENINFPDINCVKYGTGINRYIITGVKDYYDPTKFLHVLNMFSHFIKHGFVGVNGEGDHNIYKHSTQFIVYLNIKKNKFKGAYLKTYELTNRDKITAYSLEKLTANFIGFIKQYMGNTDKKRLMMLRYARNVSVITPAKMNGGDNAPFITTGNLFHPPNLLSAIQSKVISNKKAMDTMKILASFTRSISHYMNRIAKESTTGGVIYTPLKTKSDGSIFKIGDAISFKKNDSSLAVETKITDKAIDIIKKLTLVDNKPLTNIDIYKKIYYIWKITYYFGGAGTDPSGSSGNTMRVYLTDSGIHWQSSYEEKDITTRIAESMQLNRLSVKL